MPSFATQRRVPFDPRRMYEVVADVERYPEFLPLCEGLTVVERDREPEAEILTARMTVGWHAIRETFTTRVRLEPGLPRILVSYLDGPFSRLENRWRFLEAPGGCDVDFFIDYAFRSAMLGMLVGGVFDAAVRRYSEAFEARARALEAASRAPAG